MNSNISHKFNCNEFSGLNECEERITTQSYQFVKPFGKKRRGMIEKRRRDRINNCLLELKRLVPTAIERQNSQKLEKAEILQLTVDYLKIVQAKGDLKFHEAQRLARHNFSIGFKECLNELTRCLSSSTQQGLDFKESAKVSLLDRLTYLYSAICGALAPEQFPNESASESTAAFLSYGSHLRSTCRGRSFNSSNLAVTSNYCEKSDSYRNLPLNMPASSQVQCAENSEFAPTQGIGQNFEYKRNHLLTNINNDKITSSGTNFLNQDEFACIDSHDESWLCKNWSLSSYDGTNQMISLKDGYEQAQKFNCENYSVRAENQLHGLRYGPHHQPGFNLNLTFFDPPPIKAHIVPRVSLGTT